MTVREVEIWLRDRRKESVPSKAKKFAECRYGNLNYKGDPRSNANLSVISSTFGISKNGLYMYIMIHVYHQFFEF